MSPLFRNPTPAKPLLRGAVLLAFFAVAVALVIAQTSGLNAQTPEPTSSGPASQEADFSESQAQSIDRMLMCPVCPAQTIAQSQVEIALQMRAIVRTMLAEGEGRDDILLFFRDRYGKDILAAPPKSGANLVAWLLPVGGVMAALVGVFFIIRSMTRRGPALAAPQPVQDEGLAPYLRLVDRHLDLTRGGGGTSNQPCPAVESSGTENPGPGESG